MRPGARLFFAIRPPPPVRGELARVARHLASANGGRAVSPARLHLTLSFIGIVDPCRIGALLSAAGRVRASAFSLCVDRMGMFAHARVGWAGCRVPPAPLLDLQARLAGALAQAGLGPEPGHFAPHVTLVRDLGTGTRLAASIGSESLCWHVRRYTLLAAEPGQARYTWMGSWPLQG